MNKVFRAALVAAVASGAVLIGAGISGAAPQDAPHPMPLVTVLPQVANHPAPAVVMTPLCSPLHDRCASAQVN